jgi:mono/diheme cytochrome c family protein
MVVGPLVGCGGAKEVPSTQATSGTTTTAGDLTPWQMDHGVGPITAPVALAPIDAHLVKEGKEFFDGRCGSCHKPNERYVGPALGGVVGRRTPEYVMNMVLAPDSMVARHPEAKKLFATYMLQMPNLGLTPEQAREVLEYLRTLPAPPALPAQ